MVNLIVEIIGWTLCVLLLILYFLKLWFIGPGCLEGTLGDHFRKKESFQAATTASLDQVEQAIDKYPATAEQMRLQFDKVERRLSDLAMKCRRLSPDTSASFTNKDGTLYTNNGSVKALNILISANLSGTKINIILGETNQTEEFLRKFPSGKVPAYETKDGKCLQRPEAIALYVSNEELQGGKDPYIRAQIFQWIFYAQSELTPTAFDWLCRSTCGPEDAETGKVVMYSVLQFLDEHLRLHTYLVGDGITIADIAVFSALLNVFMHLFDAESRNNFVNIFRWFDVTMLKHSKVQETMKTLKFDFSYCVNSVMSDPSNAETLSENFV